jgi:hypothetical protein
MRTKIFPLAVFITAFVCSVSGQTGGTASPPIQPSLDPIANISSDLSNISRSVAQLSERLKQFVDKFEKVGGLSLSEKQQRFIMGLEILVRSEQRVATLEKMHTDQIEKQIAVKGRLTQIELDLRPQSLDQNTRFEGGGSQSIEIRETRQNKLLAEQRSLMQLMQQIDRNVADAEMSLREAQSHVQRLRRALLPQIEKEIGDPVY